MEKERGEKTSTHTHTTQTYVTQSTYLTHQKKKRSAETIKITNAAEAARVADEGSP